MLGGNDMLKQYQARFKQMNPLTRQEILEFMAWLKQEGYFRINYVDEVNCIPLPLHDEEKMKEVIDDASLTLICSLLTYYIRMEYLTYDYNAIHYKIIYNLLLVLEKQCVSVK